MPLTATQTKNARPRAKDYKLSDGGGLYLLVKKTGGRLWRLNYRFDGKQKTASFGPFPEVTLAEAREKRGAAKKLLRDGVDPVDRIRTTREAEKAVLAAQADEGGDTFETLSLEYRAKRTLEGASPKTREKYDWLHRLACSEIGALDPMEIEPRSILPLLKRLELEGKLDAGARVRTYIGQVMRHGIANGQAQRDPSTDLKGAIAAPKAKSHAAIKDPEAFGKFLCDCDKYTGHPVTVLCMQLSAIIPLRSSELRKSTWDEFDYGSRVWRVPKERMKGDHPGDQLVPLSTQALAILTRLHAITGRRRYLFETMNTPGTPLAENTINQAFRRMGYLKDVVTYHGYRTTFSTLANEALNEEGDRMWDKDWIERQLAHVDGTVRGVYNAAEYITPRHRLLQWWADECDRLRGYSVVDLVKIPEGGWERAG